MNEEKIRILMEFYRKRKPEDLVAAVKRWMERSGLKLYDKNAADNFNSVKIEMNQDRSKAVCFIYRTGSESYEKIPCIITIRKKGGDYMAVETRGIIPFYVSHGDIIHNDAEGINAIAAEFPGLFEEML